MSSGNRCYLEYHNDAENAHKFWTASVEGRIFKSSHGRIGSRGRVTEFPAESAQAALKLYTEKYNEKIKKRYVDLTDKTPSSAPSLPSPFRYNMTWKVPATSGITSEMAVTVIDRMSSLSDGVGRGRWTLEVLDGYGGPALKFVDVTSGAEAQFGFMPSDLEAQLSHEDRAQHVERGINGYLNPSGFNVDGGVIATDGLWLDLAVRSMLLLFSRECAGLAITCDHRLNYADGRIHLPDQAHQPKFVWVSEWPTLEATFDELGLLSQMHRNSVQLKAALAAQPRVTVW
jgi:predicted DNA-binding WGR domain protein